MTDSAHPFADLLQEGLPNLFTIPSGQPFLTTIAADLLRRYAHDPLRLSDVTIYLPTRRAVRALMDAFLQVRLSEGAAVLLPSIRTLGDIDEEAIAPAEMLALANDLPPPMSAMRRRFSLAQFVLRAAENGEVAQSGWDMALASADELSGLLDSFYAEDISFEALQSLVPEQHAEHWDKTLRFLKIVSEHWPAYLQAHKAADPAAYRRDLIEAYRCSIDPDIGGTPSLHPVIIAGSTGSMPAVARLMRTVAASPQGFVILPGLDLETEDAAWEQIEDPHPQAGLKHLLDVHFREFERSSVRLWPGCEKSAADRQKLLSLVLRPAEATADWLARLESFQSRASLSAALDGISLIEADTSYAEAKAIAIAMRETLNTPDRTAILVTPDRELARRTSLVLERWGIRVDDSAGVPFANTACGNFLRLVATWLADPSRPANILALLKHPLCRAGFQKAQWEEMVSTLDLVLRGLRPGPGFVGLRARCAGGPEWDALSGPEQTGQEQTPPSASADMLVPLLDRLEEVSALVDPSSQCGRELLTAHLRVAEQLAADDLPTDSTRLWSGVDGEAGASLMRTLYENADLMPALSLTQYAEAFPAMIAGTPVRQKGRGHPRLQILGPLEARLQYADLIILGGLNEASWPDEAKTDSFLSRPMRAAIGLPSPERRIGLSAHDFAQGAGSANVMLTRSRQKGRAPTKPSRWLVRLKNILTATQSLMSVDRTADFRAWDKALDATGPIKAYAPPEPCPPVEARPDTLPVTAIEKLLRDPYSIFARYILRLRNLEGFDLDPDRAVRGRFYHSLFARFAQDYPDKMPTDPQFVLREYAQALFARANVGEETQVFWQARMEESFTWFADFHATTLQLGKPLIIEGRGSYSFTESDRAYKITARADRIDQYDDGTFIYDYKTGKLPSLKQEGTFSPQLQLTGLIMQKGGFDTQPSGSVAGYAFLKVLGDVGARTQVLGEEARENILQSEENLRALLKHYDNISEPYRSQPRPFYRDDYGDYDHLARRPEWAAESAEGAGE
ncbi:double-strand break repair protein AddB [Parvularcula sp. IMCC14364]|uniref:double-strand break repair protein AddB n=1 Tax=Parvularcula sp. IMCC14364 TaxID=3067902 RepID=UPI0027409427|nr:double-strand break repair protein AddB [Parvularcula sp. IMCC14364]